MFTLTVGKYTVKFDMQDRFYLIHRCDALDVYLGGYKVDYPCAYKDFPHFLKWLSKQ